MVSADILHPCGVSVHCDKPSFYIPNTGLICTDILPCRCCLNGPSGRLAYPTTNSHVLSVNNALFVRLLDAEILYQSFH